jgi:hypothetical protein
LTILKAHDCFHCPENTGLNAESATAGTDGAVSLNTQQVSVVLTTWVSAGHSFKKTDISVFLFSTRKEHLGQEVF